MKGRDEVLKRAIGKVGTAEVLARALAITPQALSQWKRVPPLRVIQVERVTGVSRYDLRPDLYPKTTAIAS